MAGTDRAAATPAVAEADPETEAEPIARETDLAVQRGEAAYRNTSFDPDRRAASDIRSYVQDVNGFAGQLRGMAGTPQQQAIAEQEIARYREGYIRHQNAMWDAQSRTASPMITGPARFPVESNRKRMDTVDKRNREFLDWREKSRQSATRRVRAAMTADMRTEEKWQEIKREIDRDFQAVRDIRAGVGNLRGLDPNAFSISIKGKLTRLAANGEREVVSRALDYLRGLQADMPRPIFTDRNAIWQLGAQAEAAASQAAQKPGETKVIATFDIARVEDHPGDDRVRIFFDGKPSEAIRADLKREAWKWSPNAGAWQRQMTPAARASADRILSRHGEKTD